MPRATYRFHFSAAVLAGLFGLAWFFLRFRLSAVDVRHIDWLMRGDWSMNELGWLMFRHVPWQWPLGAIPSLLYPVGTTVALTDSIPLVALLLKPFEGHLPQTFQYF